MKFWIKSTERVHLYLWLAKDLSWVQEWYLPGMGFGTATVAWSLVLLCQSMYIGNHVETWHQIGQLLWLAANFWWMWGEIHDVNYPEPKIYNEHHFQSGILMLIAFVWICLYYCVLWHLKLLPEVQPEASALYDECEIHRGPFTWREYENLHTLFWIGKDTAWIYELKTLWCPYALITLLMSLDFVVTTPHDHYVAQAFWVLSNLIMAFSELYLPEDDTVYPLIPKEAAAAILPRWWAAWAVVVAFACLCGSLVWSMYCLIKR